MIQASQFAKMNFSDSKRVQLKVSQELWHREISLSNQTLGIVGLGRVGTRVATYATAFGMQVVYYDPLIGNSHNVYRKLESIEELFLKSDIVSINASLNIDNVELVSAPLFSEFTKRLTLVNSARAELVNESDVLSALDAGRLRKYFSDVYQGDSIASEPGPLSIAFDSGAYGERLQLTPHVGGYSTDSWIKVENVLIDRLKPILVASL
jgi:D-3-phosphoglycerate dehydrogenase